MEFTEQDRLSLRQAAVSVARNAYVPYSRFPVGAAALAQSGDLFAGCNIENASFGMTLCAEASLIAVMVTQGQKGIALICCRGPEGRFLAPCGRCRQMLVEIGGADCAIDLGAEVVTVGDILPYSFTPRDMGVVP